MLAARAHVLRALAAIYLVAMPFMLRHLERDIERRVVSPSAQNEQADRAFGLDRSS
jgi:hypothetical protein